MNAGRPRLFGSVAAVSVTGRCGVFGLRPRAPARFANALHLLACVRPRRISGRIAPGRALALLRRPVRFGPLRQQRQHAQADQMEMNRSQKALLVQFVQILRAERSEGLFVHDEKTMHAGRLATGQGRVQRHRFQKRQIAKHTAELIRPRRGITITDGKGQGSMHVFLDLAAVRKQAIPVLRVQPLEGLIDTEQRIALLDLAQYEGVAPQIGRDIAAVSQPAFGDEQVFRRAQPRDEDRNRLVLAGQEGYWQIGHRQGKLVDDRRDQIGVPRKLQRPFQRL